MYGLRVDDGVLVKLRRRSRRGVLGIIVTGSGVLRLAEVLGQIQCPPWWACAFDCRTGSPLSWKLHPVATVFPRGRFRVFVSLPVKSVRIWWLST